MFNQEKSSMHSVLVGIILIIAAGITTIIIFSSREKKETIEKPGIKTEEQKILENNKEAIDSAIKKTYGQVNDINDDDHVMGGVEASVQFIVYSDFECPYCAQFSGTIKKIKDTFGDSIIIAFRHFPLSKHRKALLASIASECAAEQGEFWEMHDKIFEDNKNGNLEKEQFVKDAEDIGLDADEFSICLDDEKYKDKIEAQIAEGKSAGVLGTPNIFVNGQTLQGAYPFEDFVDSQGNSMMGLKSIIEKHLKTINN